MEPSLVVAHKTFLKLVGFGPWVDLADNDGVVLIFVQKLWSVFELNHGQHCMSITEKLPPYSNHLSFPQYTICV